MAKKISIVSMKMVSIISYLVSGKELRPDNSFWAFSSQSKDTNAILKDRKRLIRIP